MKKIVLLVSIIFLCLPASARAAEYELKVVVLGDSLAGGYQLQSSEAFTAKLKKKLRDVGFKNLDVTQVGEVDDNSTRAVARIDTLLAARPDVVVIALGLNDVIAGVNPNVIYSNIASVVERLKKEKTYIVLMGLTAPSRLGPNYARQLENIYFQLAKIYSLPFYRDALAGISDNQKYTLADEIHPNAGGVDIMVEGMYRLVDYGLRWRLQVIQYQEQYRQSQMPKVEE